MLELIMLIVANLLLVWVAYNAGYWTGKGEGLKEGWEEGRAHWLRFLNKLEEK